MADLSRPVTGYPTTNGYPQPPPGTAYAYQAPPPPHSFYQTTQQPVDPRFVLLRRFCGIVIVISLIFATILVILWLIFRPTIPEFRVDSLSVSNFNLSSQRVNASWNLRLQVYNPNERMTISYSEVTPSVFYKSEYLAETRVPPFQQSKKNHTLVEVSFAAVNYADQWVLDGINAERTRGSVTFTVKVVALARFRSGAWRARARVLRVSCPDVPLGITASSSSGKLVGASKSCRVAV